MEYNTFIDLFEYLKNENDLIEWLKIPWKGKDKQESVLRLFTGLELTEKLKEYKICKGNFNLGANDLHNSWKDIFYDSKNNPINLKDKGNSSDLTCKSKIDGHLLVTTSKNINNLSIGKLDIEKIVTNSLQYQNANISLCICVRDAKEIDKMKIEETSREVKKYLDKAIIIDWNDLNHSFNQFKRIFKNRTLKSIIDNTKSLLINKLHQRLSVLKTLNLKNEYLSSDNKSSDGKSSDGKSSLQNILWGHIPRSGKSYIIGGCIIEDNKSNYLIITTAPNETLVQQIEVFNCFQLKDYNIILLNGSTKVKLGSKNIILCSEQFLKEKKTNKSCKIQFMLKIKFDIIFVDECHNGATTLKAKNVLEMYGKNSFIVHISASYTKVLIDFDIRKSSCILWDMEDIKCCKTLDEEKSRNRLIEKHGQLLHNVFNEFNLFGETLNTDVVEKIKEDYLKYPELMILTDKLHPEVIEKIKLSTQNNDYGWSITACYLLKQYVDGKDIKIVNEFQNEENVLNLWYRVFGKKDEFGIPDSKFPDDIVFMKRIKDICRKTPLQNRFIGNSIEPMIIMTFLPNKHIDEISTATKTLLEKYKVIEDYDILCINGKISGNPKQSIENARNRAKSNGKKGVLVLSGKQCSLGVSLDFCDIVILMNDSQNFDSNYQKIFRCMTEAKYKNYGFVIDLNLRRAVESIFMKFVYMTNPTKHPKDSIKKILSEKLINFNADHYYQSHGHPRSELDLISKYVYDIYSVNTSKNLDDLLNRIRFKKILLTKDDQKLFNIMFNHVKYKDTKRHAEQNSEQHAEQHAEQNIKNGIEVKLTHNELLDDSKYESMNDFIDSILANIPDPKIVQEKEEKNNYMNLIAHIIPFICLLTIGNSIISIIEMFEYVKMNEELYIIFIKQIITWWGDIENNEEIINFIQKLYLNYLDSDEEIKQNVMLIKEVFIMNISKPKELSKSIDKYLIPQEVEKKKNAEVSTPCSLRNEMLNTIPVEFWTTIKKVFEPCAGKGGFIVDIIDRFMEGLKELISDEKERYKTIVEQCLYFSDINSTNIFICKLLIDPYNEYKLNYNEGDTLLLDMKEKWNINGFDAVIGNPPYQPPSNDKKGGVSIWNEFVSLSLSKLLKKEGYLVFVHPALWRKPNNKLHDEMFSKQIHYLSIYSDSDGNKLFGATTRFDYYLLENTPTYKSTRIIFEDKKEYDILITKELPFIPNFGWSLFDKVFKKLNNNGIITIGDSDCHTSRSYVSKTKKINYDYILLNSISKTKGKTFAYSLRPHKVQNKKKVLFSNGRHIVPFYDNGELGITQGGLYIIVNDENEGKKLVEYLNSKLVVYLIKATKWSNFETCKQLFWYIPFSIEIDDINSYFALTHEEIITISN
jgi:hypothetical protein